MLAKEEEETLRRFGVPLGRKGAATPGGYDGVLRLAWRAGLSSVWLTLPRLVEVGAASVRQGNEIKGVVPVSAPGTNVGLILGAADSPTPTVAAVAGVESPLGRTAVGGSDACVFRGFLAEEPGSEEEACPPFGLLLLTMT